MVVPEMVHRWWKPAVVLTAVACLTWLACASSQGRETVTVLHIGSSGSLGSTKLDGKPNNNKGAVKTLKRFIKEETGFDNEITPLKSWQHLAEKLVKGDLQLGVFEGYEFAWARHQYPSLRPLALAVNVYRYPVAYVITNQENKASSFADLAGQTFCLPKRSPPLLHLFVERQSKALGKKMDTFFAKVTSNDIEDAIDDTVDGVVNATVVDRAALEAFRSRKPARFKRLKEIAHSPPVAPVVVAYADKGLNESLRQRFLRGLLDANKKERGKMILTLFRLTAFEPVPADFDKVLERTRKFFPPPDKVK